MSSFLMVLPTGKAMNETVGAWVTSEQSHAIRHWRQQFRGEARAKNDDPVPDADISAHTLILWGDPGSNKSLARIAARLPIRWDAGGVRVGSQSFSAAHHVPV